MEDEGELPPYPISLLLKGQDILSGSTCVFDSAVSLFSGTM